MDTISVRNEMLRGKTIYDMELNVGYYARVSTDKDDQLNSLENQSNYFKDMISENKKWNLVGEYIDEGISGTSVKNRENFLRMIEDSKKGKLDLIVTKEISRFSRNVIDSIKYTEELLKNGTVVYFISDNINTIYPDSEFRLTLMSSLAQDEVRKLSERVKFGIQRMIKDGKLIGGSLTGYYRKDGRMIINEEERPIIEILFNLYVTGRYSFERISEILYKKGYKNKKGEPYSGTTLKKFLINPRYKGYYTANMSRVESYKNHKKINLPTSEHVIYKTDLIEPIVSEELWDKANEVYNKKHKGRCINVVNNQSVIENNKYTNKIFCIDHDEPFIRNGGSNRRNNPTWTCREYKRNGVTKCNSPIIREKELDKFIVNILYKYIDKYITLNINEIIDDYENILYKCNNINKIKKEEELNRYIINKDKLIDLNLNGIISREELERRLVKNDKEIEKINSEIKEYKTINSYDQILKQIKKEINNYLKVEDKLNVYINLLIDKIEVIKGGTRHKMNFIIYFKDGSKKCEYFEN